MFRDNKEIDSFERIREAWEKSGFTVTWTNVEDYMTGDITINGRTPVEVKCISNATQDFNGNSWYSTSGGLNTRVRYKKASGCTNFTVYDLLTKSYGIINRFDFNDTTNDYNYGLPDELKDKQVIMVNLDCEESSIEKNKFFKCIRYKVDLLYEFRDCFLYFKWEDLEKAMVGVVEMWVKSGHTTQVPGDHDHRSVWERKAVLDVSKATMIRK